MVGVDLSSLQFQHFLVSQSNNLCDLSQSVQKKVRSVRSPVARRDSPAFFSALTDSTKQVLLVEEANEKVCT